jgi:hypothetical protein
MGTRIEACRLDPSPQLAHRAGHVPPHDPRHNRDGSLVHYVQLAHNERDPDTGQSTAKVIYSFGREDQLDRAALHRLADSIHRYV